MYDDYDFDEQMTWESGVESGKEYLADEIMDIIRSGEPDEARLKKIEELVARHLDR